MGSTGMSGGSDVGAFGFGVGGWNGDGLGLGWVDWYVVMVY